MCFWTMHKFKRMVGKEKRCAVEDFSSRMMAASIRGGAGWNAFNQMNWLRNTAVYATNHEHGLKRVRDRSCDKEFGKRVVLVKLVTEGREKGKIHRVGAIEMPEIEQESMGDDKDFVIPEPLWMPVNQHQSERDHRVRVLNYGSDGHLWQLQKHVVKNEATIDLNTVTEIVPHALRMKEDASFVYLEQNHMFNGIYKVNFLTECSKPAFRHFDEFIEPSIKEPFNKDIPFFVDSVVSRINRSSKALLDRVTNTVVATSKGIARPFSGKHQDGFEPRILWGLPYQHIDTMINPVRVALGPKQCVSEAVFADCASQMVRTVRCHASPESLGQAIALSEQDTYKTVILVLDSELVDKISFESNTDHWFLMLEMIMQSSRSFPHILGVVFQFNAHPQGVSKHFLSSLLDAVVNLPSMERTSPNILNTLAVVKRIVCLNMVTQKTPWSGPLAHILEARKFTPFSCGFYQNVRVSENAMSPMFVPGILPPADSSQLVARADENAKLHLVVYDKRRTGEDACPVGHGWKEVYLTDNRMESELRDTHTDEKFEGNVSRFRTHAVVLVTDETPDLVIRKPLYHIAVCSLLLRFRPRIIGITTFQAVRSASLETFENDELSPSPVPEYVAEMSTEMSDSTDGLSLATPLMEDLSTEELFFVD